MQDPADPADTLHGAAVVFPQLINNAFTVVCGTAALTAALTMTAAAALWTRHQRRKTPRPSDTTGSITP